LDRGQKKERPFTTEGTEGTEREKKEVKKVRS
jgi:hypothetical protein